MTGDTRDTAADLASARSSRILGQILGVLNGTPYRADPFAAIEVRVEDAFTVPKLTERKIALGEERTE